MGMVLGNLVSIAVILYLVAGVTSISLLTPFTGEVTDNRMPTLSWSGLQGHYTVMLDDNPDFVSPIEKETFGNRMKLQEGLDFGKYYWKVVSNGIESRTGEFSIVSTVELSRSGEEVKNTGNTNVWLSSITGAFVLGVNESAGANEEENVKAEQY